MHHDAHTKVCTEQPPASYTSSVENRLKADLPLLGTTEAQAEGVISSYLEQKSGVTETGEDVAAYTFYICQMAHNGGWSEAGTARLIDKLLATSPASTPAHPACIQQLQKGYALKDSIDEEFWRTRRDETFQGRREELTQKWDRQGMAWASQTEAILMATGGAIDKGRFRNASISSSAIHGTNAQWNGIRNYLQGRLLALEAICKRSASQGSQ